ncbi:MAG: NAD(P)H-hydrate dehydratase [Pseudomonadota bacterium]
MKFCTAAEMRRLDDKTIKECGLPGVVLMENAGRAAAALTARRLGKMAGLRAAVVCGRGNNGGDGFVMARIFHGWGALVRVFLLCEKEKVGGDARVNLDVILNMGLEVVEISREEQEERLDLGGVDLIVDAILGTGLNSEVRGVYRLAIDRINASKAFVVAVDIPSGVDSDSGRVLGTAVRANLTATFGLPKIGLLLLPGEELAGELEVVDIGIPPHILAEADPGKELVLEETLAGILKKRSREGHKGAYGHVLVVAGSVGKTGAAALTALAAARAGAGLVTLAVPASLNPILEVKVTEAMTEPLDEDEPGFLSAAAAERVLELARGKAVLALGPGLSARPGCRALVRRVVVEAEVPLIIDADGLNSLEGCVDILKKARREVLITPHPGEMGRLLGRSTDDIALDRLGAAAALAAARGAITVLKGYRTIIAAPDGRLFLNTTGGPHLASGGMGDVLTGIAAGLAAQGLPLLSAARLGVFAHGLAADEAAVAPGAPGLLASDLLSRLPGLWPRFIS